VGPRDMTEFARKQLEKYGWQKGNPLFQWDNVCPPHMHKVRAPVSFTLPS